MLEAACEAYLVHDGGFILVSEKTDGWARLYTLSAVSSVLTRCYAVNSVVFERWLLQTLCIFPWCQIYSSSITHSQFDKQVLIVWHGITRALYLIGKLNMLEMGTSQFPIRRNRQGQPEFHENVILLTLQMLGTSGTQYGLLVLGL
jgi:hypothetical protein